MSSEFPKNNSEAGAQNEEWKGVPEYARRWIEKGEIGPVYFHGQTVVVVPWDIYQKMGEGKILEVAARIYGEKAMERDIRGFSGEAIRYYHLELPPKKEDLLEKLLEELKEAALS